MSQQDAITKEETHFSGKRIRFDSALPVEKLLENLDSQIGKNVSFDKLNTAELTRQAYEANVRTILGPGGFVTVAKMEYTDWLAKYHINRRVIRWICGNPLIAITMLKHDQTAALFMPTEILVLEEANGRSSVTYVLPSSTIAIGSDLELKSASEKLDAKLEALVSHSVR